MTAATDDPTQAIKDAIKQGLASGQPPVLDPAVLTAASPLPNLPIVPVVIDFARGEDPLAGLGLYRLATMFPGVPLAQWIPRDGLLSGLTSATSPIAIDQMGYTLQPGAKGQPSTIIGVSVRLALGAANSNGWQAPSLGFPFDIVATLQALAINVSAPFSSPTVFASLSGELVLGGVLTLDVTLDCPSFNFTATEKPFDSPNFSQLLGVLKLPAPADFSKLELAGLQFTVMPRSQAIDVQAQIVTPNGDPFPIGTGDLALDSLSLSISSSPGATTAQVSCSIIAMKTIMLGAMLQTGAAGWKASIGLDVSGTWALLHPSQTPPATPEVSIDDLLGAFGLGLPSELSAVGDIQIAALDGSVTVGSTTDYSLHTLFDGAWSFDGFAVSGSIDLTVDNTGGSQIVADIVVDGFEVIVTGAVADGGSISVTAPHLDGLTGTYAKGVVTLSLKPGNSATLGGLVADFIGIFTGEPYTSLPSPWDALNDIDMSQLSVSVDLTSKMVTLDCAVSTPSILGCSISSVSLSYNPNPAQGASNYSFGLNGSFPILGPGVDQVAWDPTSPSKAPTAPGLGAAYFDILLAAVGQHITLTPQPTTVEDALNDIATLAKSISNNTPLPTLAFDAGAGWLIGARMMILNQVDVRLVFADPEIYGLHVLVSAPASGASSFSYLDALDGLSAEILYRKVSDTVGVYEGFLTLPDKIRKIDMGAFELQLPSFSVEYFTNGDFEIDIGYPANGDFSHSAVLSAAEFYGSGGLLFGKLSQVSADNLPAIETSGTFGTVIELGLGFQVGIYKSFSAGPMSASLGVLLQGIFQGTFAKFSTQPDTGTDQFYNVYASVTIIGKLEGSLDFVIITASLLVEITLSAAVQAIAHQPVTVPMSASVDVELTVSINCGLFTIHIHVGFSTSVSYTATFGGTSQALWNRPGDMALRMMRAEAPAPLPALAYPPLPCAPLPLNLYVVPQLTRGMTSPGDPTSAQWTYIVQTALDSPDVVPPQGVTLATSNGPTANDLVFLLAAWMITTWQNQGAAPAPISPAPAPADWYKTITVTAADIGAISDYLQAARAGAANARLPAISELNAFFGANLTLNATSLTAAGDYGLAFFPLPPGTSIATSDGTVSAPTGTTQDDVLSAYVLIAVLQALHSAQQAIAASGSMLLSDLYAAMSQTSGGAPSQLGAAVGTGTRFMLHGTRTAAGQPLYAATGQEVMFSDQTTAAVTLTIGATPNPSWGLVTPAGGLAVAIPSQITPLATANFATTVDETGIVAGALTLAASGPRHFVLATSLPGASAWVRAFPSALAGFLDEGRAFRLQTIAGNTVQDVAPGAYAWAAAAAFTVRQVPAQGSTPTKPTWLAGVYELVAVQSDGLDTLEALYRGRVAMPVTAIEVAYAAPQAGGGANLVLTPAGAGSGPFIFRSNISTQTNPSPAALRAMLSGVSESQDPIGDFITQLMTGGLTNSGGYYLSYPPNTGLPADLFDANGLAHLQLVAQLGIAATQVNLPNGQTVEAFVLSPTVNAVRATDAAAGQDTHLFAMSDSLTTLQATVPIGTVGLNVARPTPQNPSDANYQLSLNNLFNLLACAPTTIVAGDGTVFPVTAPPKDNFVTGPATKGAPPDTLLYQRLYDLLGLTGQAWPADPVPVATLTALSPYRFVGGRITVGFEWVDIYGDLLPTTTQAMAPMTVPVGYTDAVGSFNDWPGLVSGYTVEGSTGARTLTLHRTYVPDPGASPGSGVDAAQRLAKLTRQYATLYHQLDDIQVSLSAAFLITPLTQLTPDPGKSVAAMLQADIVQILNAIEAGATERINLPDLVFALPSDDGAYNTTTWFPLAVSASFTRQGPVDPAFASDPTVRAGQCALSPFATAYASASTSSASPPPSQGYAVFAQGFEGALSSLQMKVLVGDTDAAKGAQLWVMRYGSNGFNVQPGALSAYAPPPFLTSLISRTGIQPTINGSIATGLAIGAQNVSDVDLDAFMGQFLTATERLLSPTYGVPASIADPNAILRVLKVKEQLAMALGARAVSLADGSAASAPAIDVYQQACLTDLTNYYGVDAIAQFALTMGLGANPPTQKLDLYARLAGSGATQGVAVSPGKAIAASTTAIAFALSAQTKGQNANAVLPSSFQIDAIEVVTGEIQVPSPDGEMETYNTGTWLRFVLPPAGSSVSGGVPLPLRAYPTTPHIIAQRFSTPPRQADVNPLLQALEWTLDLDCLHRYVAQDTLVFTATLNIPPPSNTANFMALDATDDLLDTLSQFLALYPNLSPIFDQMVKGPAPDPTLLTQALDAYAAIAEAIYGSFYVALKGVSKAPPAPGVGDAAGGHPFTFSIVESFDDPQGPWKMNVTASDQNQPMGSWTPPLPTMEIQPQSSALIYTGTPNSSGDATFVSGESVLTAPQAMSTPARTLSLGPLSIIDHHSGLCSLGVIRNAWMPTAFVYQTPVVQGVDKVRPFLSYSFPAHGFDIRTLPAEPGQDSSTDAATLTEALTRLYINLVAGFPGVLAGADGSVQTTISLAYNVQNNLDGLPIREIPILLDLPEALPFNATRTDVATIVQHLTDALVSWRGSNPTPEQSWLRLAVTVFSTQSETGIPIIELEGLIVPCGMVQWV